MKPQLVLIVALASALAGAQTADYRVFLKGKPAGTVRSTFSSGKSGYIEDSKGALSQNGREVKVNTRTELDAKGNWKVKVMEAAANGKRIKATATPKGNGAHIVISGGPKTVSRDIPKRSNLTTTDATAKWFRGYTPKLGETAKYQRFDMQRMQWADVDYRYIGPKQVELQGKKRSGFAMERTENGVKSVIIVDSAGLPILLDSTDMRMERIYPK
jgi:hypothetical protein